MQKLWNSLNMGMTCPVYLFYGTEALLMEQAVTKLTKLVAPEEDSWNRLLLRGDECSVAEVLDSANSGSFFAGKKLVIVRGVPWFAAKKSKTAADDATESSDEAAPDVEALLDYIRDPNPDTVLVLTVNGAINKNSRVYKAVVQSGRAVEFAPVLGSARELWLKKYLHAHSKSAAPNVLAYVCLMSGDGLAALKSEADKLMLYCGRRSEITLDDAEQIISRGSLAGVFELTDQAAAGNAAVAVATLRRLLQQGESAHALIGLLGNQYRTILAVRDMQSCGFNQGEIASALGANPYFVKKCAQQGRRYSVDTLTQALDLLLSADAEAKFGRGDVDVLLELALLKICRTV